MLIMTTQHSTAHVLMHLPDSVLYSLPEGVPPCPRGPQGGGHPREPLHGLVLVSTRGQQVEQRRQEYHLATDRVIAQFLEF